MFLSSFFTAYRIHVNQSTVKILRSINDGYKIDTRGKTELKVSDTFLFESAKKFIKYILGLRCVFFFFFRVKGLKRRTGLWEK